MDWINKRNMRLYKPAPGQYMTRYNARSLLLVVLAHNIITITGSCHHCTSSAYSIFDVPPQAGLGMLLQELAGKLAESSCLFLWRSALLFQYLNRV